MSLAKGNRSRSTGAKEAAIKSAKFVLIAVVLTLVFLPAHVWTARAIVEPPVYGSGQNLPTLTIAVTANNGARTFDLKLSGIVQHPWCVASDKVCDGEELYGWALLDEKQGIPIASAETKTFTYTLPYGVYNINVCWGIQVDGGLLEAIVSARMVVLGSDTTVNFVVN